MASSKLKGDFCKLSFLEIRAYISLQQWFSILMAYQLRSFFKKCWCRGPTTKQLNQNLWADNQASVVSFCSPSNSDVQLDMCSKQTEKNTMILAIGKEEKQALRLFYYSFSINQADAKYTVARAKSSLWNSDAY